MARDMKKDEKLPIDLRSKKSESKKTEHKCLGGNEKCGGCAPIIPTESLVKTIKEEKTGGGYCGGESNCNGKKSCMECEEKPPVGIDYSRN